MDLQRDQWRQQRILQREHVNRRRMRHSERRERRNIAIDRLMFGGQCHDRHQFELHMALELWRDLRRHDRNL